MAKSIRRATPEEDVRRWVELNREIDELAGERDEIRRRLAERLAKAETPMPPVKLPDGASAKAVLVSPMTDVIDEEMLRKRLGAKTWLHVTTRVLSKAMLLAAIKDGKVDANIVAQATTTVPGATPYVKLTVK